MAVLAFQLEGRVHQPPRAESGEVTTRFQEGVKAWSGEIEGPITNLLATKLPSGMDILRLHPTPKMDEREERPRDRGLWTDHGFAEVQVSGWGVIGLPRPIPVSTTLERRFF